MVGQGELGQSRGDEADNLIAGLVAPGVVERLEVVDVAQDKRQLGLLGVGLFLAKAQRLVEQLAVGDTGERVGERLGARLAQRRAQLFHFL